MKDRLIFDTTDSNTIADSDAVGAYLRSSDGTLLTHTTLSGKESLDVNVANASIVVTATDLDIRDLDASQDNVAISDGTDTLAINADGSINITDNGGSLTVDAIDLDIRNLSAAQDNIESWTHDGTGTAITSRAEDGGQALDVHVTGSATVTVNDAALANTAIATNANALDVADTAENVVASPLANRKYLFIYNNGNRTAYVGESGVSSADGFPLSPGSYLELRAGPSVDIEWVSSNTSQELRTLELS